MDCLSKQQSWSAATSDGGSVPDGWLFQISRGTGFQPLLAVTEYGRGTVGRNYGVTRDGQKFLINAPPQQIAGQALTVTTHWLASFCCGSRRSAAVPVVRRAIQPCNRIQNETPGTVELWNRGTLIGAGYGCRYRSIHS
jgi:hypothetical protein